MFHVRAWLSLPGGAEGGVWGGEIGGGAGLSGIGRRIQCLDAAQPIVTWSSTEFMGATIGRRKSVSRLRAPAQGISNPSPRVGGGARWWWLCLDLTMAPLQACGIGLCGE